MPIRIESIEVFIQLLMGLGDVENSVYVLWIQFLSLFVVHHRVNVVARVIVCARQVEVALRARRVQFYRQLVRVDRLFVLLGHVVGVAQVVEGGIVLRV